MLSENDLLQNRYKIGKLLGQGGMGAVYLAMDTRFNSEVAIKETRIYDNAEADEAFAREASLLNKLRHPALTHVIDYFSENNGLYLVMQYIKGVTLDSVLRNEMNSAGSAVNYKTVIDWMLQTLDALDYMHNHEPSIIHQDIKPQNLILTAKGKIILLDFGLAKTKSFQEEEYNSMIGATPHYASIEQLEQKEIDPRSDLYSLGATAYHLLTGEVPTNSMHRFYYSTQPKGDPLQFEHSNFRNMPSDFIDLLKITLSLNKADRPKSASVMAALLKNMNISEGFDESSTIFANSFAETEVLPGEEHIDTFPDNLPKTAYAEVSLYDLSKIYSDSLFAAAKAVRCSQDYLAKLPDQSLEHTERFARISRETSETAKNLVFLAERLKHLIEHSLE